MNCPKCSVSLPNNLLLCPACGHNLRSSTTPPQASGSSPVLSPSAPHGPAGPPQPSGHTQSPVNPTIPFVAAPAGFWLRVAAFLLDYVITTSAWAAVYAFFIAVNGPAGLGTGFIVGFVLSWFYEAGMTASRFQGTLGKRVVGLKVLTDGGEQLTFGKATARYFLKSVLWLITLGLITIPAGIRKDKKTGYDLLIHSTVFRR